MKKILLSFLSAFLLFTLSAQVSENFEDYTVGEKLAQQAQGMGRMYWTTWSGAVGGAEDGIIAEASGNKYAQLAYGNDQVCLFDGKNSGVWDVSLKINVPSGQCGYFNILAAFAGAGSTWAVQVYFNKDGTHPGVGTMDAGGADAASFTFTHGTWIPCRVHIDLDNDAAEIYINNNLTHSWTYSAGTFNDGCPRVIDALNIYPPTAGMSTFYLDDIVFASASGGEVLFETNFDDLAVNAYVAQSYPDWWTTWDNNPGTGEDALISNEQAASPNNSAKCTFSTGTDLVFKAGNKTSGAYTIDFDMYIPTGGSGFFNLLHIFAGSGSEWAIGVYFNTNGTGGMPTGTVIVQNNIQTPFTFPYATWFPVHFLVDLDNDLANISINGTQYLEWQFSLNESGGTGTRQLAAVDFYPPQTGSVYYFDNFVYAAAGATTFPVIEVTPTSFSEFLPVGGTVTKQVTVKNTGTSMGDYYSWIEFDFEPPTGSSTFTLTNCTEVPGANGGLGFGSLTAPTLVELAHKFTADKLCNKLGTKITKLAYFVPVGQTPNLVGSLKFRVYGPQAGSGPGEVLAEASLSSSTEGIWNEVTLSQPVLIDKTEFWISVEFTHQIDVYPMGVDDGPLVLNANYIRRDGGGWSAFTNTQYGNYLIKATTQGGAYLGSCWLTTTGESHGTLPMGATKTFNAKFDAAGLELDKTYNATLVVTTSDELHALYEIPCTLTIGDAPPTYKVSFIIADEVTTEPITGATIVFDGETLTGTEKEDVEPGTYPYIVSKEGYETKEGTVTVVDKDVVETVLLKPDDSVSEYSLVYNIYPNPANTHFVVARANANPATIIIYNTMGMQVVSYQTSEAKFEINVEKLATGTYFIRVIEGQYASVKSFVKQ